jgi:excisionase family DNA binding protein
LRGTTRQAVAKLVKKGRIRTMTVGGHVLVRRTDISEYKPQPAGRRKTKRSR